VFLAVIAVAIHPAAGALTVITVAAAAGWTWRSTALEPVEQLRRAWPAAACGALVVAISYGTHLWLSPGVDSSIPESAWPLVQSFIRYWDAHRQPIGWGNGAIRLVAGLAVIGFVMTRGSRNGALAIWWRALMVVSILGLAGAALTSVPPEAQARWLIALMPGRLMNLSLMLAIPSLIGLALSLRGGAGALVQTTLALGLLASGRSLIWPWLFGFDERGPSPPGVDQLTVAGVFALVVLLVRSRQARQEAAGERVAAQGWAGVAHAATLVMAVAAAGLVARDAVHEARARRTLLAGSVSEVVLEQAAGARAILIGGDLLMVQLRTRRPIVLDSGALDVVTYAPAAAPAVERMLNDLYGVSLLAPPEGLRPDGRVPVDAVRGTWRRFTRDDWRRLSQRYGFSHVVASPDWGLQLESLATGGGVQTFQVTANK
jgi:hypothetical protein